MQKLGQSSKFYKSCWSILTQKLTKIFFIKTSAIENYDETRNTKHNLYSDSQFKRPTL